MRSGRLSDARARRFAKAFGFAFQIKDDLLDEGTEPDKLTFVSVYGERAKALLREYSLKAEESMSLFKDKSGYFVDLVKRILTDNKNVAFLAQIC